MTANSLIPNTILKETVELHCKAMYNLNCVCFSTIVSILSLAVLFTLTIDQDKGKAEKNVPIIVMLFGSKNSSTHRVF